MLFNRAKAAACINRLRNMSVRKLATLSLAAIIGLMAPVANVASSYADTTSSKSSTQTVSADDQKNSQNAQNAQSAQSGQGQAPSGQPPAGDPPEGAPGGQPPADAPQGQPPSGNQQGQPPAGQGGSNQAQPPAGGQGGGADTQKYDYSGDLSASKTADGKEVTITDESMESSKADQNVALSKDGGTLTITGSTLKKSGDSQSADNTNFYGTNASVLAVGEKSKVFIDSSGISSTSEGSNGIFATDNATVYANNVAITTKDSNSARGLDATYGGTIIANNMTISTEGDHCATLATDRGGGNISVTNSTLSTKGSGSPLLYSTGNIQVDNVNGSASGSQIAGMEGLNRILISNSTLESTNDNKTGSDPIKNGVILYQSTSGDADTSSDETAYFQAVDSTLKTNISGGAMFYVTNTEAKVVLSGTTLDFDSEKVNLISAVANDNNWGQRGSNGGKLTFTGIDQTLSGDIQVDKESSVNLYLLSGSSWTGALEKGSTAGNLSVNVDGDSAWILTKDTKLSTLNAAEGAKIVDQDGKTVTIKAGGKTVVKGESSITLTVSKYSSKVKTSKGNKVSTATIDRTDFDKYYKTSTAYGDNSGSTGSAEGAGSTEAGAGENAESLWEKFLDWLKEVA